MERPGALFQMPSRRRAPLTFQPERKPPTAGPHADPADDAPSLAPAESRFDSAFESLPPPHDPTR